MAAAADGLNALVGAPVSGPETVPPPEDVDRSTLETPDEWDDDDEWRTALDAAFEKADIRQSRATLTTKTTDSRDYYYLQWREGDSVTSQYVPPVTPAE